jgi:hypothetical protein
VPAPTNIAGGNARTVARLTRPVRFIAQCALTPNTQTRVFRQKAAPPAGYLRGLSRSAPGKSVDSTVSKHPSGKRESGTLRAISGFLGSAMHHDSAVPAVETRNGHRNSHLQFWNAAVGWGGEAPEPELASAPVRLKTGAVAKR